MRNVVPLMTLLFANFSGIAVGHNVTLDGGSSLPTRQSNSYTFRCPDGDVTIEVGQERGEYPVLQKLIYSRRSLLSSAAIRVNDALRQFRALESVSPRCLTGGGAQVLLAGLKRDEIPRRQVAFMLTIDKGGRVSLGG
jgi:hypothetical protein